MLRYRLSFDLEMVTRKQDAPQQEIELKVEVCQGILNKCAFAADLQNLLQAFNCFVEECILLKLNLSCSWPYRKTNEKI